MTPAEGTALGFDSSTWGVNPEWVNLADSRNLSLQTEGLTFSASFTPVPEASTYAIGGVILCLGLTIYYHRKRLMAAGMMGTPAV